MQATNNNEVLVWDITLQGVSPFSIFFVEQKNKKWIVSKYTLKINKIKYVHWQNTHKVEENGGEL